MFFNGQTELIDVIFINSIQDQSVSIIDYRAIKKVYLAQYEKLKTFFHIDLQITSEITSDAVNALVKTMTMLESNRTCNF